MMTPADLGLLLCSFETSFLVEVYRMENQNFDKGNFLGHFHHHFHNKISKFQKLSI